MSTRDEDETMIEAVAAGDRRMLARAITEMEAGGPRGWKLRRLLKPPVKPSFRLGITGAPGVGKSTLVGRLIGELRQARERVAVLAVDPTSPVTGGALLGDRFRMRGFETDPGVFIRSLASRRAKGGISSGLEDAADLLELAGFALVLMETVGIGQLDHEVTALADRVYLLLSPESGDVIQFLKGGVMEVVDRVIVHKADRPGASELFRLARELSREEKKDEPLLVSSETGVGVSELVTVIREDAQREVTPDRTHQRMCRRLRRLTEEACLSELWSRVGGDETLKRLAHQVEEGRVSLASAAASLLGREGK